MTNRRTGLVALDAKLASLGAPTVPQAMLALPVMRGSSTRLIRGWSGEACVLIASSTQPEWADLKLRNVQARAAIQCQVEAPDGAVSLVDGTLITCTASDPQLRRLFLELMDEALTELGSEPSSTAIAEWIRRIASLFSQLEQEGRKTMRGLWAELLTMVALGDPETAARRWHIDTTETFDFTAGGFSIEVKSCLNLDRVHHFSLRQLRPPKESTVWVASVVVRADSQGSSVIDILHEIEAGIVDIQSRQQLRAMVMTAGGRSLEEGDIFRFDRAGALQTFRLIDIRSIPSIKDILPDEVLTVTLEVRCRAIPAIGSPQAARDRLG